jgi:hypothetical protein
MVIRGHLEDDVLEISIRDYGGGLERPHHSLGLHVGLDVIRQTTDSLDLYPARPGTFVALRFRLYHPNPPKSRRTLPARGSAQRRSQPRALRRPSTTNARRSPLSQDTSRTV